MQHQEQLRVAAAASAAAVVMPTAVKVEAYLLDTCSGQHVRMI